MADEVSFDARVVLGVAAKASQVFEQEGTYFSYPLSPLGFREDELQAMTTGATAEGKRALAEFSYLVNALPAGPLWSVLPNGYLWDVYGDVLDTAQLADSTRNEAEEASFQRAYEYLHDTNEDESVSDSAVVIAYRQYRDAWLVVAEEYKNAAAEAAASDDPEVGKRWREVTEPALTARKQELEHQWDVEGHRAEVEDAQRIEERLGQRSPAEAWANYRKLFDPRIPEIFFETDVSGGHYVPTAFRPTSALNVPWPRISLTRDELTALAASSPPALRERLGEGVDSGVVTLSFEYSSVAVSRPWFVPDVFSSHGWRFFDQSKVISDGGEEGTGLCPAYVAALVLLRNLRVSRKVETGVTPPPFNLGALHIGALRKIAPIEPQDVQPVVVQPETIPAAERPLMAARVLRIPSAAPAAAPVIEAQLRSEVRLAGLATPAAAPPAGEPSAAVAGGDSEPVDRRAMLSVLKSVDFARLSLDLPPPVIQPAEPAPSESIEVTTTPADEIYVLGFICKRVPKSPDPDYTLSWPGETVPPWPGRALKQPPAMKGEDVRTWQAQMKARGWSISVDGTYDERDEAICRKFQAEKQLQPDGVVGRDTWRATWAAPVT
jgi:hypothetical protein